MMETLSTAYDAIELLESLGLPISQEQLQKVKQLELQYITDVIVPHIQKECEPLLEDLIGGCHLILDYSHERGLDIRTASEEDLNPIQTSQASEGSKSSSSSHDRTKYSIDGGQPLTKRRFVLSVVKKYVEHHPYVSLEELERQFPSSLNSSPKYGVCRRYDEIMIKVKERPDLKKRFFLDAEDLITLIDGTKICIFNQWGKDFNNFLGVARRFHQVDCFYEDKADDETTNHVTKKYEYASFDDSNNTLGLNDYDLLDSPYRGEIDYVEAFWHLIVARYPNGEKCPHKAILLLSVIRLIESGRMTSNRIYMDDMIKNEFDELWKRYRPNIDVPSVWTPFWYLKKEQFWHFQPRVSTDEFKRFLKLQYQPSAKQMREHIQYAYIDEELVELIKNNDSEREQLIRALMDTYIQPR